MTRRVESSQSSQKVLKTKFGTNGLKAINVAWMNFRPPPFERRNQLRKNLRINRGFHLEFCFFEHPWVVLEYPRFVT
jgi:hypothetical protein